MLISVIVPVYKVEKYIHRCVDSVLNQTFTDFELILVDDGSPDNCGAICDEYALKDNRIHVIHKENGGLSDARNAGIDWAFERSDSEWLTFIDSDDWVHPKYLEELFAAAKSFGNDISVCSFKYTYGESVDPTDNEIIIERKEVESFFCELPINAIVAWGKLYKKVLFSHIRYPYGRLHEDEFVTYKVLFKTSEITFVNYPLYYYYQNHEGIINSKWSPKKLDLFDAHIEQYKFFQKNNYFYAERCVAGLAFSRLRMYYDLLCCDKTNKRAVSRIRQYTRFFLKQKDLGLSFKKEKSYVIGYPKMIRVFHYSRIIRFYNIKRRIRKKIKRILRR